MRAYCGDALGSLDHFSLRQVPVARPGRGEILVAVEATALGFVDPLVMRGLYQMKPPVPFVPGGEIVGIVEQVGEGVAGFEPGQRVASWQFGGGLADKAVLGAQHTVAVPSELAPEKAAALLLDYLTAYYGLFDRGGLKPGQTLLVTGASGGVGSAAVQLASASAASVIGLASGEDKQAMVSALGAVLVIDYRDDTWRDRLKREFPRGVDMVFDPVGGALFEPCFRSLVKRGRHLVVGFASGDGIPSLPANLPLLKSGELAGVDARYLWESEPARVREILSIVLAMGRSGRIDPPIARTFALADAREAIACVSASDRLGKVVVTP
ncbi:Phthiocerol synthesis polyketide synthase type I PpsC [Alteriqipengyuania sp. 357]